MDEQEGLVPALRGAGAVRCCWMCGIRLSAAYMVADGGSACADVRWYCLDTRGCTERWTSQRARAADIHQGTAETWRPRGRQLAGPGAARPAPA